jgi:hypothetical protein
MVATLDRRIGFLSGEFSKARSAARRAGCRRAPCDTALRLRTRPAGLRAELDSTRLLRRALAPLATRRGLARIGHPLSRTHRVRMATIRTTISRGLRRIALRGAREALRAASPIARVDRRAHVRGLVATLSRRATALRSGRALVPWLPPGLDRHTLAVTPLQTPGNDPTAPSPPPPPGQPTPPPPNQPPPPPPPPTQGASSIKLVCPASSPEGDPVAISGSIEPAHAATVTLEYTRDAEAPVTRQVATDANGSFADTFKPTAVGTWKLTASWPGDGDHSGAQASCTFQVGK